uniref:Retrotransposon protein, putative, unclassified n=1 Tax=Oryza sativa subsp. japonica TaxID=39947 RepID=Q2R4P2_ORYSJ|nr:retrotransposon protein, putative, unclassified [Oryza sativa Japonica Group]
MEATSTLEAKFQAFLQQLNQPHKNVPRVSPPVQAEGSPSQGAPAGQLLGQFAMPSQAQGASPQGQLPQFDPSTTVHAPMTFAQAVPSGYGAIPPPNQAWNPAMFDPAVAMQAASTDQQNQAMVFGTGHQSTPAAQPHVQVVGSPFALPYPQLNWPSQTDRAGKAVMVVEEVQALHKEFDAQWACQHWHYPKRQLRSRSSEEKQCKLWVRPSSKSPSAHKKTREEEIPFDVVDIPYNYNAIFGRGTLNKFEAISHHNYLKLKMPGPTGVIVVKGFQPSATAVTSFDREVHTLQVEGQERAIPTTKPAPHGKIFQLQIDDTDPTKVVSLGGDLGEQEVNSILAVLSKNIDIFAWGLDEVGGVSPDLIVHHLAVKPDAKPKK